MTDKKEPKEMPRSVSFFRAKDQKPGLLPNDRLYIPYEGAPSASISDIRGALSKIYDLVLLHDEVDGCLLLTLMPDTPEEDRIVKLTCKLHDKSN